MSANQGNSLGGGSIQQSLQQLQQGMARGGGRGGPQDDWGSRGYGGRNRRGPMPQAKSMADLQNQMQNQQNPATGGNKAVSDAFQGGPAQGGGVKQTPGGAQQAGKQMPKEQYESEKAKADANTAKGLTAAGAAPDTSAPQQQAQPGGQPQTATGLNPQMNQGASGGQHLPTGQPPAPSIFGADTGQAAAAKAGGGVAAQLQQYIGGKYASAGNTGDKYDQRVMNDLASRIGPEKALAAYKNWADKNQGNMYQASARSHGTEDVRMAQQALKEAGDPNWQEYAGSSQAPSQDMIDADREQALKQQAALQGGGAQEAPLGNNYRKWNEDENQNLGGQGGPSPQGMQQQGNMGGQISAAPSGPQTGSWGAPQGQGGYVGQSGANVPMRQGGPQGAGAGGGWGAPQGGGGFRPGMSQGGADFGSQQSSGGAPGRTPVGGMQGGPAPAPLGGPQGVGAGGGWGGPQGQGGMQAQIGGAGGLPQGPPGGPQALGGQGGPSPQGMQQQGNMGGQISAAPGMASDAFGAPQGGAQGSIPSWLQGKAAGGAQGGPSGLQQQAMAMKQAQQGGGFGAGNVGSAQAGNWRRPVPQGGGAQSAIANRLQRQFGGGQQQQPQASI